MSQTADVALREQVRARYAQAATAASGGAAADEVRAAESDCCSTSCCTPGNAESDGWSGPGRYDPGVTDGLPAEAVAASLGCGNPLMVAQLREGERVLDLGSGGGIDVLLSAQRVGPSGFAYGVDMTDEMLDLARANAAKAGATNVEFLRGDIEAVPLPDEAVDVVISNCVINLSSDKAAVLAEVARVLRPGGRFAVSDVIADPAMDAATRADMAQWTGCIAGALTREEFERRLLAAGLVDVEIRETHRVHEHAAAAIVRATKAAA